MYISEEIVNRLLWVTDWNSANLAAVFTIALQKQPQIYEYSICFFSYVVASIDMIREVMKRWWKELQMMGKKEKQEFEIDHRCSR